MDKSVPESFPDIPKESVNEKANESREIPEIFEQSVKVLRLQKI